jgi:hypothetical protein
MKIIMALIIILVASPVYATDCDMGGMVLQDYAYYIAMLGIACGVAFILGIKQ